MYYQPHCQHSFISPLLTNKALNKHLIKVFATMMPMFSVRIVTATAMALLLSAMTSTTIAQVEVRDSKPVGVSSLPSTASPTVSATTSPAVANTPAPANPVVSAQTNLYYQLQALQQEVQQLRGLVEEQAYQLKKIKQQRLDDYLDLDRRIGEISKGSTLEGNSTTSTTATDGQAVNDRILNPSVGASLGGKDKAAITAEETALYRKSIDQVLKQQDYASAQRSFQSYLDQYPNGRFVPNVYYWQGEIFLVQNNNEGAAKAFSTLLKQHPEHNKVPDAKFKLAKLYFQQGKKAEAKPLLNDVVNSNTDASRLARSFLDKNY